MLLAFYFIYIEASSLNAKIMVNKMLFLFLYCLYFTCSFDFMTSDPVYCALELLAYLLAKAFPDRLIEIKNKRHTLFYTFSVQQEERFFIHPIKWHLS